jgi:hypothetical protein
MKLKCNICGKGLSGKQTKFCSLSCKNKDTNFRHQNYVSQKQRGLKRKIELIELFGGKCEICGYKRNYAGLSFHHLTKKTFPLDARNCSNKTWDKLLNEAKKCKLLCLNCHLETHYPDLTI